MLSPLCVSWWSSHFAILIASLSTIIAIFWLLKKSNGQKSSLPLPPGPRGLPIVGYLPFLGTELHRKFDEMAKVYGPIHKLWFGNKLCVVLSSPSVLKEVVRDHDTIFANRDSPIAALIITYGGKDIAFSSYGPEWRKLRKIFVREMQSNTSIEACYALRKQEIELSIRDVFEKIDTPINIGELALLTATNAAMSMVWGGTLQGEMGADIRTEFRDLVRELMILLGMPNVSDIFPLLATFDIQGIEKRMKKISVWCDRVFTSIIDQRMHMNSKENRVDVKKDFLQYLLEFKDHEDDATSITLTQLKGMLMDIVVGGTDTLSTVVEWAMTELLLHPEIMRKVNEELTEIVGTNNMVEETHLSKLHYLDAVAKETMRLHPPLPLLVPRCPSQSCNVAGYTIPKDAKVFINVWAIQRDPQLWDNPLEFRPERFLNNSINYNYSGNNFQYLPFGSGRRMCAGIPLGERMLMYMMASFLHSFDWKLPNETKLEVKDKFGIVLKKLTPLVAIPTPRLPNLELYHVLGQKCP